MKLHLSDLDELTHDELATQANRAAKASGDTDLLMLAVELRKAVDGEAESAGIVSRIREHLESL